MSNESVRAGSGWLPRVCLAVALAVPALIAFGQQGAVKSAITEQSTTEQAAKQTQAKVDALDDETHRAVQEYRALLQENDSLKRYNDQLAVQIKSQDEEMTTIASQLEQIETTSREIVPLVQKMLETLEKIVASDLPFLQDERTKRVNSLKEMMTRADVSIAEKYRRIVEAYQIEMEYGRTLEAYTDKIADRTVEVLRIGRIAMMYQTLDGKETGYWDADKKAWVEDSDYRDEVRKGLKVAKKQGAPDLLIAPIHAAGEAK